MTCPHCGKEMESGYLISAQPVLWSPKKNKSLLFTGKNDEKLVRQFDENKAASICKTCRIFVMKY